MADVASGGQLEEDSTEAWVLGVNVTRHWGYDDLTGVGVDSSALDARRRRFDLYARSLLLHVGADSRRLAAIATWAAERAGPDEKGRRDRGAYNAVILTEVAAGMLQDSGADTGPAERSRLLEDIRDAGDRLPAQEPSRPGVFGQHRLPRRALRRLSPQWWLRRWDARVNVRLAHRRHGREPAGLQEVQMLRGDHEVGTLQYRVCDPCRLGYVAKASIDQDYQGRGLGTRAIKLIRVQAPAYRWCTSSQYDTAQTFWRRIAQRTGDAYTDDGDLKPCHHMDPGPRDRAGHG